MMVLPARKTLDRGTSEAAAEPRDSKDPDANVNDEPPSRHCQNDDDGLVDGIGSACTRCTGQTGTLASPGQ